MKKGLISVVLLLGFFPLAHATDLLGVYQQVLQADPRVRLAELNVHIGEAREQQVIADLLPQLNLTSSISSNRQDYEGRSFGSSRDTFKGERYSAVLSQPLFDLPKYYHWQRQKKITAQSQYDQLETQQQIMLDVVQGYFDVLLAQDNLSVAEDEKVATQGILKQLENLFDKQMVKITNLMDAQARNDVAIADLLEARTEVVVARERLIELTGNPIGQLRPLKRTLEFHPIDEGIEKWLELLTENNATLLSRRAAIQVEGSGVKEHQSGHLPVVNFQLMVQRTDLGFNNASVGLTNVTSASVNANMPLFTSGKVSAFHLEAVHRLESTKLNYETEFRRLRRELRGTLTQINSSVERIRAVKVALASAEKNYKAMQKGFKYAVVDSSDLFDAQRIFSQANRDLYQSKYEYILNRTKLIHLGGMINHHEIELINQWLEPG